MVEALRERGVLTGTDGPHHNVLKLRPPLVFSEDDADLFRVTDGGRFERLPGLVELPPQPPRFAPGRGHPGFARRFGGRCGGAPRAVRGRW